MTSAASDEKAIVIWIVFLLYIMSYFSLAAFKSFLSSISRNVVAMSLIVNFSEFILPETCTASWISDSNQSLGPETRLQVWPYQKKKIPEKANRVMMERAKDFNQDGNVSAGVASLNRCRIREEVEVCIITQSCRNRDLVDHILSSSLQGDSEDSCITWRDDQLPGDSGFCWGSDLSTRWSICQPLLFLESKATAGLAQWLETSRHLWAVLEQTFQKLTGRCSSSSYRTFSLEGAWEVRHPKCQIDISWMINMLMWRIKDMSEPK